MKKIIYDVECLSNCFIVCFKNIDTGKKISLEISPRINQAKEFKRYFNNYNRIFFGYNSIDYDGPLISFILKNEDMDQETLCLRLKALSDAVINDRKIDYRLKYAKLFSQIDLMRMNFSLKLRVGLKEMQVSMFYPNVLEFEVDWNAPIDLDKIDTLTEYCWNDVDSTEWVFLRSIEGLNLRRDIFEEFNIDVYSKDGVSLGVDILAHEYCKEMNLTLADLKGLGTPRGAMELKDLIHPLVKFESKELNDFLDDMRSKTLVETKGELSFEVLYDGMVYGIGTGGIHSRNTPTVFKTSPDMLLIDGDVDSLYPSTIINFEFVPEHLGKAFLKVYKMIRDRRIEAKKRKKESKKFATLNETYKLSLNGELN